MLSEISMRHISVKSESNILNQKGFTLIELIAVMVIIGVMGSVAVKKMDLLSHTAADRALILGIKELNVRESLTWTKIKISNAGWQNDSNLFAEIDTNLGAGCGWTSGPAASGGTLLLRSQSAVLTRSASTATSAGRWD